MLRNRHNKAGFTLLEAVVALAVAGIAAIGLLRLHVISIDAVAHTRHVAQATLLADAQLARTAAEAQAEKRPPAPSTGTSDCETYRWEIAVEDASHLLPDAEDTRLARLVCRVIWHDGARERAIELETIYWSTDDAQTPP